MFELVYNFRYVKVGKISKKVEFCFFHDDFVNPWTALAALAVKNVNQQLRALSGVSHDIAAPFSNLGIFQTFFCDCCGRKI